MLAAIVTLIVTLMPMLTITPDLLTLVSMHA